VVRFTHDGSGTPARTWTGHPSWLAGQDLKLLDRHGSPATRLVVLAAHPDDESLGAAGLLATAHDRGVEVHLVLVTAGQASHPGSPTTTPVALAELRLAESRRALDLVAPGSRITHLGVPDGHVGEAEQAIVDAVVEVIGNGRSTVLLSPWSRDGHPDHEACGRAAEVASARTGARLLQFPIWLWHWGTPEELPWDAVRQLRLPAPALAAKDASIRAHRTQVEALSPAAGDERLLSEEFLAHFRHPVETFVEVDPDGVADTAFEDLHRDSPDPWGVDSRWYEQRKRDLTLAVLPRPSYERGLELGASTGALAAALATRCAELVAVEGSPAAAEAATTRLAPLPGARVERRTLPGDWPDGSFDLVVVSEVGYFLSPADLDLLIARIELALAPGGDLVLCHWRHPIQGWPLDGPAVHARFSELVSVPEIATYADRDVELSVFSHRPTPEADA
jgi:LmbE family N-acetylglucosaminyl deacetylase